MLALHDPRPLPLRAQDAAAGRRDSRSFNEEPRRLGIRLGIFFLTLGRQFDIITAALEQGDVMPEWSMGEAMGALDPIFDDLDAICRQGLAKYQLYPPEFRIDHDGRAAANCIYTHMVALADERLTDRAGIVFKNIRGLKVWIVGEQATIRFKKMDEDGRSRNYPTKQTRDYDRQMQLPGLPHPPLNLVVGYLPDPTGTEVVRVQVARPMGRNIDWCAAIVPVEDRVRGEPRWIDVTRQARM